MVKGVASLEPLATGRKPESKPPSSSTHGSSKADCVAVWFFRTKWKVTVSSTSAYWRLVRWEGTERTKYAYHDHGVEDELAVGPDLDIVVHVAPGEDGRSGRSQHSESEEKHFESEN